MLQMNLRGKLKWIHAEVQQKKKAAEQGILWPKQLNRLEQ